MCLSMKRNSIDKLLVVQWAGQPKWAPNLGLVLVDPIGSAFTLTLANIFMCKWEKELVRRQLASIEIYGR
jgi:hypothetical protein